LLIELLQHLLTILLKSTMSQLESKLASHTAGNSFSNV